MSDALRRDCEALAKAAREASRVLAASTGRQRAAALRGIYDRLLAQREIVLQANARDIEAAPSFDLSEARIDRLRLTEKRLDEMRQAVAEIRDADDPLGQVTYSTVRPNGLQVYKVRVPIGVILFIYESRPNVTTDAAALCIKSGNAIILRGGKEAWRSNQALARVIRESLIDAGLPADAVQMAPATDRAAVGYLLQMSEWIDLAVPRGGVDLIRRVAADAKMPVLKHYLGVCHVYLDESADETMASAIVLNAKCQRPAVCNAMETLLVHRGAAARMLPNLARQLREQRVELRGCPATRAIVPDCAPAADDDFGQEFGALILAIKVVDDLGGAIEHIHRYGSGHTEAIVTSDWSTARAFVAAVDASAVMVNASTRFNDGGQFGLGAEIGISTDKIHARGPCGLNELTSYKYIVHGDGHVRE